MKYMLLPEIATMIGPGATASVEASMAAVIQLPKPVESLDASFALARHLFTLVHTPSEGMDP